MIRNKLEALQEKRVDARNALEWSLSTDRGSKEARAEAKRIADAGKSSNTCQACNGPLLAHTRLDGYCRYCRARFDRMLTFKSKLKREMPKTTALQRFIEDYKASQHLPYALRGAASRETIIGYAEALLAANIAQEEYIQRTTTMHKEQAVNDLSPGEVDPDAERNEEEIV